MPTRRQHTFVMSAHLLINVWHGIASPWNRIGLGRLLRGINLTRAQRNLSRTRRDFRTGRDFASARHDETRSSTSGTALPEVVVNVYSLLSPSDPLSKTSAGTITAITASKGIPIAKEKLRRPPTKPLRRLTHRIVHAVRESAKDPVDGTRRALEAMVRLDNWLLDAGKVSGSGVPAGSLTQAAIQTSSKLRLQEDV